MAQSMKMLTAADKVNLRLAVTSMPIIDANDNNAELIADGQAQLEQSNALIAKLQQANLSKDKVIADLQASVDK